MDTVPARVKLMSVALAVGGVLFLATDLLHPRGEPPAQLVDPLWTPAHLLLVAACLTLWMSLRVLVRTLAPQWRRPVRIVGWITVGAVALAMVESIPHLLAVLEAEAVAAGGPAPLFDLHSTLEMFTNVLLGFSVVALSALTARSRALGGGPAVAALAVIGGTAFGLANPVFLITGGWAFAFLFDGSILMGLWFLASGLLLARRTTVAGPSRWTEVPAS